MAGSVRKDEASWYYVLERIVNGKRKQSKRRGFNTKREAQRALTEAQNAVNKGTYIEPNKVLYSDYLAEWMRNRRHQIKKQTYEINSIFIKTHIIPMLGNILLTDIRAANIQNFITELTEKNLCSSTIRRIYSIVNASLNEAVRTEILAKNFASLVSTPKVNRKELQVWNTLNVQSFLNITIDSRYSIAFHLALLTGMRQGEILGLRWTDVDFDNRKISVNQTLSHDGKELQSGAKTSSSVRTIAIGKGTIEELRKHRKRILEEKLKLGEQYKDYDLVVCTNFGTPASPRNILRTFYQLTEKAKLSKISFHDLRHTHATILLSQNVHPKIVSERLGHSKIQMTLDLYSHLLPNMQQDTADEIDKLLMG